VPLHSVLIIGFVIALGLQPKFFAKTVLAYVKNALMGNEIVEVLRTGEGVGQIILAMPLDRYEVVVVDPEGQFRKVGKDLVNNVGQQRSFEREIPVGLD
jgi:hypothetical protein